MKIYNGLVTLVGAMKLKSVVRELPPPTPTTQPLTADRGLTVDASLTVDSSMA